MRSSLTSSDGAASLYVYISRDEIADHVTSRVVNREYVAGVSLREISDGDVTEFYCLPSRIPAGEESTDPGLRIVSRCNNHCRWRDERVYMDGTKNLPFVPRSCS